LQQLRARPEIAVAPSDLNKLKSHLAPCPPRRSAKPRVSTYFDTADLALDNAHMSLRVRASGDRIVQTLKRQTAPSSGFSVRMEYEIERANSMRPSNFS
jgi:inorganic triphosphatase YgiF